MALRRPLRAYAKVHVWQANIARERTDWLRAQTRLSGARRSHCARPAPFKVRTKCSLDPIWCVRSERAHKQNVCGQARRARTQSERANCLRNQAKCLSARKRTLARRQFEGARAGACRADALWCAVRSARVAPRTVCTQQQEPHGGRYVVKLALRWRLWNGIRKLRVCARVLRLCRRLGS